MWFSADLLSQDNVPVLISEANGQLICVLVDSKIKHVQHLGFSMIGLGCTSSYGELF